MFKSEATLRVNIFERGNPRCSVCGQEFGREGFAKNLIEAFALHVRRQHIQSDMSRNVVRRFASPATARITRAKAGQR
jgi:hypothetical protein